jgi:hypothetical protein
MRSPSTRLAAATSLVSPKRPGATRDSPPSSIAESLSSAPIRRDEGFFGNAVLVDGQITDSEDAAFEAQLGSEERRWLSVETDEGVRTCTAHLSVAGSDAPTATNDAQCEELTDIVGRDGQHRATIFGGDVNHQESCAPAGFWTGTDATASQVPGIQHTYGSRGSFLAPEATIIPMTYTDHDGLLVESRLRPSRV